MKAVAVVLAACLAVIALPARSQRGPPPYAVDGDSIVIDNEDIRLFGIDAPELNQLCRKDQQAGRIARAFLMHVIDNKPLTCKARGRDLYGRSLMTCLNHEGQDIARLMVEAGWAWAYVQYALDYTEVEYRAKRAQLGVHGMACQPPWEWRREQRRAKQR